jgi:nucleoside-triphosphatase THEP1
LTKQFSKTNLSLKKKVSFVRAKGGEFALKVSVTVSARKFVEKVNIIDRLPPLVKLHEKFGGEMPRKVDENNRRIEWHFDKLQEGESRILSYVIYSKVGVLGKFALPTTTAIYEKDGEVHEAESNHAFFIADQIKKVEE